MPTRTGRWILPLLVLCTAFFVAGLTPPAHSSSAGAGDEGKKKPAQTRPTQTQKAAKPRVFTDEDLEKYHPGGKAPSTRPAAKTPPSPPGNPLKPFQDRDERARWRQEKVARLQDRVLSLEGKLRQLEQKRLSIVNPYVPRASQTEGEKAEEEGLSGPERLARTDEEIKQTTEELEAARKELAQSLEKTPE